MVPFARVWQALESVGVRYVVVGGVAAVLHGNNRVTADLDVVVDLNPDQVRKAVEALLDIGLQSRLPVDARLFANPVERKRWRDEKNMQVFSMYDPANPAVVVDLLVDSPMDFEILYGQSEVVRLSGGGVRICSLGHLIELKERCGRPQDLIDVENLRRLQPGADRDVEDAQR